MTHAYCLSFPASEVQIWFICVRCFGSHQTAIKMSIRVVVLPKTWDMLPSSYIVGRIHFLAAVEFMTPCLFKASSRNILCCFDSVSLGKASALSELSWVSQSHPGYSPIWLTEIRWIETLIISAKSFYLCYIMWVTSHSLPIFYWLKAGYMLCPHSSRMVFY